MYDNNNGNIVIYQSEDGKTHLEVKFEQESLWLSQHRYVTSIRLHAQMSCNTSNIFMKTERC